MRTSSIFFGLAGKDKSNETLGNTAFNDGSPPPAQLATSSLDEDADLVSSGVSDIRGVLRGGDTRSGFERFIFLVVGEYFLDGKFSGNFSKEKKSLCQKNHKKVRNM